jgi:hypothetical protein
MSPDEARILRVVAQNREFFSVGMNRIECNVERAGKHYTYQGDGFVTPDPECSCPQFTASYVNNLSRLGLIEYEQNTSTDPIKKGDETKYALSDRLTAELRSILAACGVLSARIVGGHITLTDFGRHFVSACMTVSAPNSP